MSARPNAVTEHIAACAECAAVTMPAAALVSRLDAAAPACDAERLAASTLARLRPELAALAGRAFWRRVVRVLVPALVPLPFVVAADAALLAWVYRAAAALLPSSLALYLVASYATAAIVGIGLAYAAIPLLLAPRHGPAASA